MELQVTLGEVARARISTEGFFLHYSLFPYEGRQVALGTSLL